MTQSTNTHCAVTAPKHYMILDADGQVLCEVRDVQRHCSDGLSGMDSADYNNLLKYALRAPFKDKFLEDLKKARFMLDALIERYDI